MEYSKLYRTLQTGIRELSDEEVIELLSFVETEVASRQRMANYDPAKDTFLTEQMTLDGGSDLAERAEDILYGESQPVEKVNDR